VPTMQQPQDWTEPGAQFVAPGVHRIPLPLPLDGPVAVNYYALEGADGLLVIDPGWVGPETEQAIAPRYGNPATDSTTSRSAWQHTTTEITTRRHSRGGRRWAAHCSLAEKSAAVSTVSSPMWEGFPIIRRCSRGAGQRDSLSVSHEMGKPGKGPTSPTADRTAGSTTVT